MSNTNNISKTKSSISSNNNIIIFIYLLIIIICYYLYKKNQTINILNNNLTKIETKMIEFINNQDKINNHYFQKFNYLFNSINKEQKEKEIKEDNTKIEEIKEDNTKIEEIKEEKEEKEETKIEEYINSNLDERERLINELKQKQKQEIIDLSNN